MGKRKIQSTLAHQTIMRHLFYYTPGTRIYEMLQSAFIKNILWIRSSALGIETLYMIFHHYTYWLARRCCWDSTRRSIYCLTCSDYLAYNGVFRKNLKIGLGYSQIRFITSSAAFSLSKMREQSSVNFYKKVIGFLRKQ